MKTVQKIITIIVILLFFAACKDEYIPAVKDLDKEILVVEGFIEGGNETMITLSRVRSMGKVDTNYIKYVTNAQVQIEDDQGNSYPLWHSGNGNYRGFYFLDPNLKYRIKFQTAHLKEYASQFVAYKTSPPIDEISYRIEPTGALFLVSTHDDTRQSKYYRWQYEETWQYHSYYPTNYQYDPTRQAVVDIRDDIYWCWQSAYSREILVNSTENLKDDIMKDIPLVHIPNGSEKLSFRYSIKVKQFAMDSVGYTYYRQLKKNTEETGSIFDPQPGNLNGNVANLNDPLEMVVGYIGAGKPTERREFFSIPWNFRQNCLEVIAVPKIRDSINYYFAEMGYWPIADNGDTWGGAFTQCVDCRTRGTNIKPLFWP